MGAVEAVAASAILGELKACGVTDAVSVPDTHQRTLLDAIGADSSLNLITSATENEAIALAAGLWIGGREPVVIIQHAGLYACVNYLRGIGLDGGVPLFLLVGLLGREPDREAKASRSSMVRLAQPLLEVLDIPWYPLDGPADLGVIGRAHDEARARGGPAAVLVGRETT